MNNNTNTNSVEPYIGSDKLICGIVLGVITFWLFAQSLVNVAPDVERSIDIPLGSLNLAISLTALFSGCFIVVAGGLADKLGRVKFTYLGFILSIIGSLCLVFAHDVILFSLGRIIQGLSAACIMPSTSIKFLVYWLLGWFRALFTCRWGDCNVYGMAVDFYFLYFLCAIRDVINQRYTRK